MFCSLIAFIIVIVTMVIMFFDLFVEMVSGSGMIVSVPRLMLSEVGSLFAASRCLLFLMLVSLYKGKARAREGRGWEGQREG